MNGCVIPNTPIAVDCWRPAVYKGSQLFFLTHMHADHTSGLTPTWSRPIYCSHITKKLLIHKFNIKARLIHELEVNESHIIKLDKEGEVTMSVTVIDANHCPGSVMFIFDGYFGRILYTGDFRACPSMFVSTPLASTRNIDVLYLDNTYCSPYCEFLSRKDAAIEICKIIRRNQDKQIVIGVRDLGKEDLLVDLAKTFNCWVNVSQQHYGILKVLEVPNVFTSEMKTGSIKTVSLSRISRKSMEKWNQECPTIAILPTALYTGIDGRPFCRDDNVFIVPYSDHSSYSELMRFVRSVGPKRVVPIVKAETRGAFGADLSDRADMGCFQSLLDLSPVADFAVPPPVALSMNSKSVSNVPSHLKRRNSHTKPSSVAFKKTTIKGVQYEDFPSDETAVNSTDTLTGDNRSPKPPNQKTSSGTVVNKCKDSSELFNSQTQHPHNIDTSHTTTKRQLYTAPYDIPDTLPQPKIQIRKTALPQGPFTPKRVGYTDNFSPCGKRSQKCRMNEISSSKLRSPMHRNKLIRKTYVNVNNISNKSPKTKRSVAVGEIKTKFIIPLQLRRDERLRKRRFYSSAKKFLVSKQL